MIAAIMMLPGMPLDPRRSSGDVPSEAPDHEDASEPVPYAKPQKRININHLYKDDLSGMNDLYASIAWLKAYLEVSSEHIYICITSSFNYEIKLLRTEYTDDEILVRATEFITENL